MVVAVLTVISVFTFPLASQHRELPKRSQGAWEKDLQSPDRDKRLQTVFKLGEELCSARFGGLGTMIRRVQRYSVPVLVEALQHEEVGYRLQALAIFTRLREDAAPAARALLKALDDEDSRVATRALEVLTHDIGPAGVVVLPRLLKRMRKDPDDTVDDLMSAAINIGPAAVDALPLLVPYLEKPKYRRQAANVIAGLAGVRSLGYRSLLPGPVGRIGVPAMVKALDSAGEDTDTIIRALSDMGALSEPAIPKLLELAKKGHSGALSALGDAGPAAAPALVKLLPGLDPKARISALYALDMTHAPLSAAIPTLLGLLPEFEDADSRSRAVYLIGELTDPKDPRVIQAVTAFLDDPDADVRESAMGVLAKAGPAARRAMPGLIKQLASDHDTSRAAALSALTAIDRNHPRLVPSLHKLLRARDPRARATACELLLKLGRYKVEVLAVIDELLRYKEKPPEGYDPFFELREDRLKSRCCWMLGILGPDAARGVPWLADILEHREGDKAAKALVKIGAPARTAIPKLRAALRDGYGELRSHIALALASLDPDGKEWRQPLIDTMFEVWRHPHGRYQIMNAIAKLGKTGHFLLPQLSRVIETDPSPRVRLAAALAMNRISPKVRVPLRPLLKQGLESPDPEVQRWMILVLKRKVPDRRFATAELVAALRHRQHHVRIWAAWSLGAMAEKDPVVQPLMAALQDDKHPYREYVAYALGEAGKSAQESAPLLREVANSGGELGRQARLALKRVSD